MRRFGTLETMEAAKRFAQALGRRGVAIDVRSEPDGGLALWVHDEDQFAIARDELAAFEAEPHAERFQGFPSDSPEPAEEHATTSPGPSPSERPAWQRLPVTVGLIGTCVAIFLAMELGGARTERLRSDLSIASFTIQGGVGHWNALSDVKNGQVWRLVTPAFMHGGPFHLLFNMSWLWLLGSAIETIRGHVRLVLLVLATAVVSNLLEYFFNIGFSFDKQNGFVNESGFNPNPFFLGMSGVVFGLFGFVWMRARLFRNSGFAMPRDTVVWMLIWLVVCTAGLVGPIANVAHGSGLLTGVVIGAIPRIWRR